jgi:hypothetical protein
VKERAKRTNTPFNIEPSDIVVPTHCPILGIPLRVRVGQGKGYHDNSPSLDRINPRLGYVKGNVRVISNRANLLKSNASSEELVKVLADLRSIGL